MVTNGETKTTLLREQIRTFNCLWIRSGGRVHICRPRANLASGTVLRIHLSANKNGDDVPDIVVIEMTMART